MDPIVEYITFADGSQAPVRQFDMSNPCSKHVRSDELPDNIKDAYYKYSGPRACFGLGNGVQGHYMQDLREFIAYQRVGESYISPLQRLMLKMSEGWRQAYQEQIAQEKQEKDDS